MKVNIILVLLLSSFWCRAQTKPIAHKSHSGSVSSFAKAYKNNLFDINRSNFGGPGTMPIVVLDTIIAVNDSITILKKRTTNTCYRLGTSYKDVKASDFISKTDTLVNHELFYKKNTKAQIIESNSKGRDYYPYVYFQNPIEKVKFIGFQE